MPARYRHRPGRPKPHIAIVRRDGEERAVGFELEADARQLVELVQQEEDARDEWLSGFGAPTATALRGWLLTYGPTMARSTRETASGLIETHLAPWFGERDLRQITEGDLIAFCEHTIETARAAAPPRKGTSVAANALSILRTVCTHHVDAGVLARNPAKGARELAARVARAYEAEVPSADAWTLAETATLLRLAETYEPRIHAPLLFLLHTGCRRGEMIGLRWEAVDLGRRRVTIRRARVRGQDRAPKSGRARQVPLSGDLAVALEVMAATRQSREGLHSDPGYVFRPADAGQWDEHNFGRSWRRLRARAAKEGVRPLKLHCTRHTFATLALEGGRSVSWVARVLGHADPALTLRTYAHVVERDDGEEMGFLDAPAGKAGREGAG